MILLFNCLVAEFCLLKFDHTYTTWWINIKRFVTEQYVILCKVNCRHDIKKFLTPEVLLFIIKTLLGFLASAVDSRICDEISMMNYKKRRSMLKREDQLQQDLIACRIAIVFIDILVQCQDTFSCKSLTCKVFNRHIYLISDTIDLDCTQRIINYFWLNLHWEFRRLLACFLRFLSAGSCCWLLQICILGISCITSLIWELVHFVLDNCVKEASNIVNLLWKILHCNHTSVKCISGDSAFRSLSLFDTF